MIDALTFLPLSGLKLGPFAPKPTSIEGDQREAAATLFASPDGRLKIGVWECTPGRFTASRETNSETCYILMGRVSLHGPDGKAKEVGAGEMLVLPKGWRGEWTIHETTRKLYILHSDAA